MIETYQTKDEIYQKLKGWVPRWFFELEEINEAVFYGMAEILSRLDANIAGIVDETYILEALNKWLDQHGLERNLVREEGESDDSFQVRVQQIVNSNNCNTIKDAVDDLLKPGDECVIVESFDAQPFCDREYFCDRGALLAAPVARFFHVFVPSQLHDPYSFCDREYFCDREDFVGRAETDSDVYAAIIETINRMKACGVLYTLSETT